MYNELSNCDVVVTVFDCAEGIQWTIAGKGLFPLRDSSWRLKRAGRPAEDSNASVIVMERGIGNLEELKMRYKVANRRVCHIGSLFAGSAECYEPRVGHSRQHRRSDGALCGSSAQSQNAGTHATSRLSF